MPASNKVRIASLEDDDVLETFQMVSQSFGDNAPFINAYFLAHTTPTGQKQGAERLLAWKRSSPESTFLKAVSTQEGKEKIIGMSIWTYMVEKPPQTLEEAEGKEGLKSYWPDEQSREWMEALWKEYIKPRTRAVANSNREGIYVLELLAVHPQFRRLGAGAGLTSWGVSRADEKIVGAVVESTDAGRPLYEKCGLQCEIEQMTFDVGDGFDAKVPKLAFMVRKATAKT